MKNKDDIIEMLLEDHKPLKKLIKTMKDSEADAEERKGAFETFVPLLLAHAKPEEQVLYTYLKEDEELREEGYEGEVEHKLAEQMANDAKSSANNEDEWAAKLKVLAELVEHHIKEEEEEVFPDFRKNSEAEVRLEMGQRFRELKLESVAENDERVKAA